LSCGSAAPATDSSVALAAPAGLCGVFPRLNILALQWDGAQAACQAGCRVHHVFICRHVAQSERKLQSIGWTSKRYVHMAAAWEQGLGSILFTAQCRPWPQLFLRLMTQDEDGEAAGG